MEPINEATRVIDLELSEFDRRCLELKARRNAYVPIAKLPNDVLLEIFTAIKAIRVIEKWHHVTHICQYWRRVALEAADLWTEPPTRSHDYTLAMLGRSRNVPLDITIFKDTAQTTREEILKHVGRITSLTLNEEKEELESLQEHFIDATTQLRILKVQYRPASSPNLYSRPPYRLTFRQPMPLRLLHLSFIDMDWQILPIRTLTSLSLAAMRISDPPSWIQLQQAFYGMRSLTDVLLDLKDLQLNLPGPNLLEPLQMPHLQHVSITGGTTPAITYFLSNIVFHELRRLYVICFPGNDGDVDALIHTVFSKADVGQFDSLFVTPEHFHLSQIAPPEDWNHTRHLNFSYSIFGGPLPSISRLVRRVIAEVPNRPISHIVNLKLRLDLTSEQLAELFGHSLPDLESIQVFGFSKAVVDGLIIPHSHPPLNPIPFSKLQTIKLEETASRDVYTPELLEALCQCLTTRRGHHSPVTMVSINCKLSLDQVRELSELVDDLEYGGLTRSDKESE